MTNPALGELAPIVRDLVGMPAPELLGGDAAEPVPGSYLLLLELAEPLTIIIRKRDWQLSAGLFVYAGSANGAGGLKARLTRHFRKEKKQHWHIDRITTQIRAIRASGLSGHDGVRIARAASQQRQVLGAYTWFRQQRL